MLQLVVLENLGKVGWKRRICSKTPWSGKKVNHTAIPGIFTSSYAAVIPL